jgi:CheY-like chemotaxis protein
MHALGLFAATLSERVRDPEVRGIIDNINASVEALESLFNELLDISKLDAGVIQPNLSSFPIEPLFERMRIDYGPGAADKGIRLSIVRSGAVIYSDPLLVERMLRNLIVNAVHYTAKGGVVVGCRPRGDRYSIEVWDSGVGIVADKLDKIFEEFYQVGNPERDRRKGLGLGLAIVKRIEQLLGYQTQVLSRPDRGSVFRFTVPRGVIVAPASDITQAGADVNGVHDKCVVVVDDELTVREGMKALLSGWGCDVIAADSLSDALQRIGEHARLPDAIIVDYRLRDGATGIEVIQTLHTEFGRDIPALLITGDIAADHLRDVRESGYPQLHKPVSPAKLKKVLGFDVGCALAQPTSHTAYTPPDVGGVAPMPPSLRPSRLTAITACVRLATPSALRIAVTWILTVPSARPRSRQMSLLGLPCISSASTSLWRPVMPRSAGVRTVPALAEDADGEAAGKPRISTGRYTPPASTRRSALIMTRLGCDFGMKPIAPPSIARITSSRFSEPDNTTTGIAACRSRNLPSASSPLVPGS